MGAFSTAIRMAAMGALLLVGGLMTSCASKPTAETEWNHLQIWRRVSDQPPTYVPKGYGAKELRTSKEGTWVADERDGKRFFVPKQGVPGWASGVLMGEAKKATGYRFGTGRTPAEEAAVWTLLLLASLGGPVQYPD